MDKELTPLEALNTIYNLEDLQGGRDEFWKAYRIIEKSVKALEIIKEKGNFLWLQYDEYDNKYYIYDNESYQHNEITKEEYDILKEVLLYEEEN